MWWGIRKKRGKGKRKFQNKVHNENETCFQSESGNFYFHGNWISLVDFEYSIDWN